MNSLLTPTQETAAPTRKGRAGERRLTPEGIVTLRRSCLTREELCLVLQTSSARVSQLVLQGCPCVNLQCKPVTDAYADLRFDLDKVLLWLKSYSRPAVL